MSAEEDRRKERKAEFKRLQRKAEFAALTSGRAETPAPESEMSNVDKTRGIAQSYLKGTLRGFGDEIVGGARAFLDNVLPDPGSEYLEGDDIAPNPSESDYKMYRDDEREVIDQFEKDYGKSALAFNVIGDIGSPLNKVLPSYGLAGGGKGSTVRALARSALEGAAYGAGEAEELEDVKDEMKTGALWGAGTTGVLRGLGGAAKRTALKRTIAEDLVQPDGTLKPYHLAVDDDSITGDLYRTFFGRIPGAKQKLQAQEAPFLNRARDKVSDVVEDWRAKSLLSSHASKATKESAADAATLAKERTRTGLKLAKEKIKARAVEETDDVALNFQRKMAVESLPTNRAGEVLDSVPLEDSRQTASAIKNWWNSNGFDVVKKKTFPWSNKGAKELRAMVRERISNDPDLILGVGNVNGKLSKMTKKLKIAGLGNSNKTNIELEDILDSNIEGIDGEALMAIRNMFANNSSGKGAAQSREVRKIIDKFIMSNLDDAGQKEFTQHIEKYTTALTYANAANSNKALKSGRITPDAWMSAGRRYGGKNMSSKAMPLLDDALDADKQVQGVLKKATARTAKVEQAGRKANINTTNKATARKRIADDDLNQFKRDLDYSKTHGEIHEASRDLRELKKKATPENQKALGDILATVMTGDALPNPFGMAGGEAQSRSSKLLMGALAARGGATDTAQLLLAGQTKAQQKILEKLLRGDYAGLNRLLSRSVAGQATGE